MSVLNYTIASRNRPKTSDIDHHDRDVIGLRPAAPVLGPREHFVKQPLSKLLLRRQAITGAESLLGNELHNQLSDSLIVWTIDRQLMFFHEDIPLADVFTSLLCLGSKSMTH